MTYEQYMDYAEKQSAEIERTLERTSETERKAFWSIYDLVTTWQELQFHLSDGIRCERLPETLKRPMAGLSKESRNLGMAAHSFLNS